MNYRFRCLISLTAILGSGAFYFSNRKPIVKASSDFAIVPRTALLQEYTESAGDRRIQAAYTHATRSDGAEVFIESRIDASTGTAISTLRKIAKPDGTMVIVNDSLGLKSTFHLKQKANIYMPQRAVASGCRYDANGSIVESSAPSFSDDLIGGIQALKVESTHGKLKLSQWFSPKHGCELIKQVVDFGNSAGGSRQDVLTIASGEPSASLFEVSQDLSEAKPSLTMAAPGSTTNSKSATNPPAPPVDHQLEKLYEIRR